MPPLPVKEPDSLFSCEICDTAASDYYLCRCNKVVCGDCFNKAKRRCFACTGEKRVEDRLDRIERLLERLLGEPDAIRS